MRTNCISTGPKMRTNCISTGPKNENKK
jgi:hypothetical protein